MDKKRNEFIQKSNINVGIFFEIIGSFDKSDFFFTREEIILNNHNA